MDNIIEWTLSTSRARFFSLARYGMIEAFKLSDVKEGDCVLIPEFICRDIVASIRTIGARVLFYSTGKDLSPLDSSEKWPKAKVVLATNYFGFPQDLKPFKEYAIRTGAVIVEDNAHGFLSKDESGNWLGLRTDIGIFSYRKTLCLSDGASIVVNKTQLLPFLEKQVSSIGAGYSPRVRLKYLIKNIPILGLSLWLSITLLTRFIRKLKTGHSLPIPDPSHEVSIPYIKNPHKIFSKNMQKYAKNEKNEIKRRRDLYYKVTVMAQKLNIHSVFPQLPINTAPYGFPFRANEQSAKLLAKKIRWLGLDLFKWPDLPNEVAMKEEYNDIWIVNFL